VLEGTTDHLPLLAPTEQPAGAATASVGHDVGQFLPSPTRSGCLLHVIHRVGVRSAIFCVLRRLIVTAALMIPFLETYPLSTTKVAITVTASHLPWRRWLPNVCTGCVSQGMPYRLDCQREHNACAQREGQYGIAIQDKYMNSRPQHHQAASPEPSLGSSQSSCPADVLRVRAVPLREKRT
jgi:hypothetical protein